MDRTIPYLLVGLLALGLMVVLGFVAARGIGELAESEGGAWDPADDWGTAGDVDTTFVYAQPLRAPAVPPERASRALPETSYEVRTADSMALPIERVRGHLAVGDETMRAALVDALRRARSDGATETELTLAFDRMILGHPTVEHCRWLRVMAGDASLPARGSFWTALSWCDDPEAAAVFVGAAREPGQRDGPPPGATEEWLRAHPWLRAPDQARPEIETLVGDSSVHMGVLEWAVLSEGWDEARYARALVRCATADPAAEGAHGEWRSAECLRALDAVSHPLAVQAARAVGRREPVVAYLKESAKVLASVHAREALHSRLLTAGLIQAGDAPSDGGAHAVAARDVLVRYGRATCFDGEPGGFPVGHDGLAVRLAWLARPALDGMIFDESEPYGVDYGYQVHAYAGGYRSSVDARNLGGRYDVTGVVGLLNSMLRERYSDVRFAWLAVPGVAVVCVVAGYEQSLLAAERDGLITLQDPPVW